MTYKFHADYKVVNVAVYEILMDKIWRVYEFVIQVSQFICFGLFNIIDAVYRLLVLLRSAFDSLVLKNYPRFVLIWS